VSVISKFAYQATWDATQLTKGLMGSRALFMQQKKIVEDSRTPMERLAIGQQNLAAILEKYPALLSQKLRLEQELERQYLREEQAVRRLTLAELSRLRELSKSERVNKSVSDSTATTTVGVGVGGDNLMSAAKAVVGYKAIGLLSSAFSNLTTKSVEANRGLERADITFEHFSGSASKAASMVTLLRKMSADAGVSFKALAEGTSRFMVQGFNGDVAIKTIAQIAEITGGIPERMDRLSYTFAQIRSKGQLYAEELQQLNEAGFSPMVELAKVLNVEMSQVRDEIANGKVTWEVFAKAIDMATDAGGRFDGFLERFKGTSTGAANQSAAAWESAYAAVGKALEPIELRWSKLSTSLANLTSASAEWVEKSLTPSLDQLNRSRPLDTGMLPGRFEAGDHKSKFIAEQARKFAEDNKNAAAKKAEQDKQKEQSAIAERQKAEAAKLQAANAPTEKGQAYLREQEQAILDLQKQLRGEKERELTIDEKIVQLRKQLTADGLNKQEVERAVTLERQRDALKQQADEADKVSRKKEFLDAGAKRGFDAVKGKDESKISSMMDLILARDSGKINTGEFDKASRDLVATDTPRRELSPIMSENSESSYKFFAGLQNQSQHAKSDYERVALDIQQKQLAAQNKLVELAKDPIKAAG
jgi:tape measure domain-containing protein